MQYFIGKLNGRFRVRTVIIASIIAVILTMVTLPQSGGAQSGGGQYGGVALAQSDYILSRDTPKWFKSSFLNFAEDVAEAAEEGKRVMIYFGQNNCPYCRRLHETGFNDPSMRAYWLEHFDSVAVNIFGDLDTAWIDGDSGSEKELARRLGIQFTPTLLFLDEQGGIVARIDGYRPPQWLRTALEYAAGGNNPDDLPFDIYMHENTQNEKEQQSAAVLGLPHGFAQPKGQLQTPARRTMVFVSKPSCVLCNEWRDYLGKNSATLAESFHLVGLNLLGESPATDSKNESEWARSMKIAYVPALVFLNPNGSEMFRAEGYLRAFHLRAVLEYAKANATETNPEFQRFLQEYSDKLRDSGESVTTW